MNRSADRHDQYFTSFGSSVSPPLSGRHKVHSRDNTVSGEEATNGVLPRSCSRRPVSNMTCRYWLILVSCFCCFACRFAVSMLRTCWRSHEVMLQWDRCRSVCSDVRHHERRQCHAKQGPTRFSFHLLRTDLTLRGRSL